MRAARLLLASIIGAFVGVAGDAVAQPRPAGDDFQVNTYTTERQRSGTSSVAMNEATGDFVVVWASFGQDGDGFGVFGQRYDRFAMPLGGEFQVNTSTAGNQGLGNSRTQLDVTMRDDASFLVVWASGPTSIAPTDVHARLYDSSGVPVTSELLVNTYTTDFQEEPRVDHDAAGNFVVVWESEGQDGSASGIFGQRLDATALPVGSEFQVPTYTTGRQFLPDVAVIPNGTFVVTWTTHSPSSDYDLNLRRFAANAVPLAGEQPVPVVTDEREWFSFIDNDAAGNLIVGWQREGLLFSPRGFFARRFDTSGAPLTDELPAGRSLAMMPNGEYVLTDLWASPVPELFGQRFDAADQPLAPAFSLRSELAMSNFEDGAVDIDANGNFALAWTRDVTPQSGSFADLEIAARTFCDLGDPTCDVCPGYDDTLDADADGTPDGCDPCTDLSAAQQFTRIDASVRYRGYDDFKLVPLKANRVRIKADLVLPGAFAAFDPITQGARVRVESTNGGKVVDVALPAGAHGGSGTRGWKSGGAGTMWTYLDSTGERINGFSKVVVRDRSSAVPGAIRTTIKSGGGIYAGASPSLLPLETIIVFGDQLAADTGRCGLLSFDLAECEASNPIGNMRCRR